MPDNDIKRIIEDIENDKSVESILLDQLAIFKNGIIKSNIPQKIIFVRWANANKEGRQSFFYNSSIKKDFKTKNKSKLWLYVFPEHREDYLIERIWNWLYRKKKKKLEIVIDFDPKSKSRFEKIINKDKWFINLPQKEFIDSFDGRKIIKIINSSIRKIDKKIVEEAILVKNARILRYDSKFNISQDHGIRYGFESWLNPINNLKNTLDNLFKEIYFEDLKKERNHEGHFPFIASETALRFLFMWQNFSVIYPRFSYVRLYFFVSEKTRACLGLLWKKRPNNILLPDSVIRIPEKVESEIDGKIGRKLKNLPNELKKKGKKDGNQENIPKNNLWINIRERYKDLWINEVNLLNETSLDLIMELTGKLAFGQHEGKRCKYYFLAGTEQVWPVVAEIISVDFFPRIKIGNVKLEEIFTKDFNTDVFKQICEANYSIFQVPRVMGFFNITGQNIYKIYRLSGPTEEESKIHEDPIIDDDDFYCWGIEKIFNRTGTTEKPYIIGTEGDGKVRIYGINNDKGELLLLWDVGKGALRPPLGEDLKEQKEIKEILKKRLSLKENDQKFRKIIRTIRKISANIGEGANLIFTKDRNIIKDYITSMEIVMPSWLRTLSLHDPHYILHAAFITDGACLIEAKKDLKINPRQAIYTHLNKKTWGLRDTIVDARFNVNVENIIKKMCGKGSKTNASSNISTHPKVNPNLKCEQIIVISISADGPIKIWPKELIREIC